MAHKDIEWAYTLALPAAQKAVLLALAHCMNGKTGRCFPSQKEICRMTGLSLATVKRSLDALEEEVVISRTKTVKGGYQSNDEYTLNHEYSSQRAPLTESPAQPEPSSHSQEVGLTVTESGAHGERAVEPTGTQPEVNTEITLTDLELIASEDIPFSFNDFWQLWPRSEGKKPASEAWARAVKREKPAVIYEAALKYVDHPHRPARQFVPHATTWLNQDRWADPLPEAPEAERRRPTRTEQNLAFVAQLAADQNAQTRGIAS